MNAPNLAPCMTLHDAIKRVLARLIVQAAPREERSLWIADAVAAGAFDADDAAVVTRLCELLDEEATCA